MEMQYYKTTPYFGEATFACSDCGAVLAYYRIGAALGYGN